MKKLIVSMFALGAILASCSKSDVMESPLEGNPISFDVYNGKAPEVKATSFATSDDSLKTFRFRVLAFKEDGKAYMDKDVYNSSETSGTQKWSYDGAAFWPSTGTLDFYAYSTNYNWGGTDVDNSIIQCDKENKKLTVTIPSATKNQRDILVASPQTGLSYNQTKSQTVSLGFKHMLSRIQFSLKTTGTTNVTIKNIELAGNFYQIGEIDLTATTPAITSTGETSNMSYKYIDGSSSESFTGPGSDNGTIIFNNSPLWMVDNNGEYVKKFEDETTAEAMKAKAQALANEDNRYMMIIPTSAQGLLLSVTYQLPTAGTFTITDKELKNANGEYITFDAGKSYNIVLNVSINSIEFSVEINDWQTGSSGETVTLG